MELARAFGLEEAIALLSPAAQARLAARVAEAFRLEVGLQRAVSRLARLAEVPVDPSRILRIPLRQVAAYSWAMTTPEELAERERVGRLIVESGRGTPPIVIKKGDEYILLDGSKRIRRAIEAGQEEIDAVVYEV